MSEVRRTQVLVGVGRQDGLAAGFHLRRAGLDFAILDANTAPGGAWQHYWDTLRLFSPAAYSSLPGRMMPPQPGEPYPDATHVVNYLAEYEKRYELPVHRSVWVEGITRDSEGLVAATDNGIWAAQAVILATGSWARPFVPTIPGRSRFAGRQLHTYGYRSAVDFTGQRVVVVGGGNSGAQIAADLLPRATVRWVTRRPPRYLPDEIDGRALFDLATRRVQAATTGAAHGGVGALGDIVAVPPVRAARDAGLLTAHPMFATLGPTGPVWADGSSWDCDTIIWCTGFRPDLGPLTPLGLRRPGGRLAVEGTIPQPSAGGTPILEDPRVHLLGYGDWTGPASATLIGVGRTARTAVQQMKTLLK
ncbi:ArsO family NAD(P)H-dependent flavin-containing monooxygenase [Kitasatospora nipponensis]|uniref:ArsO family NAD(P)H-dependent flavin-containing monooxygenase n=1 Tax=Kitasatospora nipponensis TaxID=258049 RepID=A0ABP4GI49_9ACTN